MYTRGKSMKQILRMLTKHEREQVLEAARPDATIVELSWTRHGYHCAHFITMSGYRYETLIEK